MIISTKSSDTMLRKCFGKGKTAIVSFDKMLDQFGIDPTLTQPVRDVYVVTNEDISAARLKTKFEERVQTKHVKAKIVFINKNTRPMYEQGLPGVDMMLQKPSAEVLTSAITNVIASNGIQEAVVTAENYAPPEFGNMPVQQDVMPDLSQFDFADNTPVPDPEPMPPVQEAQTEPAPQLAPPVEDKPSSYVQQIKEAGSIADISHIMREISATNLIKEMVETNSSYAGIEEKLKSINDVIYTIMSNRTLNLEERLSKVRAILHDKAFYAAKGDTLIEQRVELIIDTVCSRTSEVLNQRLSEIDTAIRRSQEDKKLDLESARLAGIDEERGNLIIELHKLQTEIMDIFKATDSLVVMASSEVAARMSNPTGNERTNEMLVARGQNVVSDETLNAVRAMLDLSQDKVPAAFHDMKRSIVNMVSLLGRILDMDTEMIAAMQASMNYLKSQNIENTVVAQSLLKKALRVFVGREGNGRTIIPYLMSRYLSRQNANVLVVDLTGSAKYDDYDIPTMSLDSYMQEMNEQQFLLVTGELPNTISAAQTLLSTLIRAADYYRVINVVLDAEQKDLYSALADDVLCINFITTTSPKDVEYAKQLIAESDFPNVAKRVIVNRCDIALRTIIVRLGLSERDDYQILTVPTVPTIADAGLNKYNPYGISAVDLAMEEVIKHAKS